MKIINRYSHLNGEEYLIVHHPNILKEIENVIKSVDANKFKTKISKEKTMKGKGLFNPKALNKEFNKLFASHGWKSVKYSYYVTTDRKLLDEIVTLPLNKQKETLIKHGITSPILSFKQTDFVKDNIAVEVQFGKYAFVAYDLFVKHLLFYSGGIINVGIEILPMKSMQNEMSTGIAYYEGEVYNVLRHGRNNPPVPLLIIGVAP
ncbi:MAG: BglII/BstYI family type II restriction endonuclease [Thermodesulfovibrionales bacterium]